MTLARRIAAALLLATTTPAAWAGPLPDGIEASSGGVAVRVEALDDHVLRVRVARDGRWGEDSSWAVPAELRKRSVPVCAAA
jgi:alpha-glucosidase